MIEKARTFAEAIEMTSIKTMEQAWTAPVFVEDISSFFTDSCRHLLERADFEIAVFAEDFHKVSIAVKVGEALITVYRADEIGWGPDGSPRDLTLAVQVYGC